MENCRSFTLNINQGFNFTGASVTTWNPAGVQFPWSVYDTTRTSDFNLEGFKNIEIYGFSLIGVVYPNRTPGNNQALIQDWGVLLTIDGTPNLINGFFGTNTFAVTQGSKKVLLSKNLNNYYLNDPFLSVKKITVSALLANGIQYEVTSIDLVYELSIIVYYKYEGE